MSENKNTKPKKERRFRPNIIDFLVVLIIIGAVIGLIIRNEIDPTTDSESADAQTDDSDADAITELEEVYISFRMANIADSTTKYFSAGDSFHNITHNCTMGELKEVYSDDAEVYVEDINGKLIKTTSVEGRKDMIGTFISKGAFTEDGFYLDGKHYVAPNSQIYIKNAELTAVFTVTDIERVNNPEAAE